MSSGYFTCQSLFHLSSNQWASGTLRSPTAATLNLLTPPPKLKPYQGEVPKSCLRPSCAKGTQAFIYLLERACVWHVFVCMCVHARAYAGGWQGRALGPGAGLSAESGSRTYQAARGRAPQCRTSGQPLRTAAGPRITEQADDPSSAAPSLAAIPSPSWLRGREDGQTPVSVPLLSFGSSFLPSKGISPEEGALRETEQPSVAW